MKFDLRITRLSYAIDLLSHTLVSFSSTAPTSAAQAAFVGFTVLSSLGAGVVPSMQSLALCTMQTEAAEDERLGLKKPGEQAAIGSLFGALAVLQATGQMILGVSYASGSHRSQTFISLTFVAHDIRPCVQYHGSPFSKRYIRARGIHSRSLHRTSIGSTSATFSRGAQETSARQEGWPCVGWAGDGARSFARKQGPDGCMRVGQYR